MNRNYAQSTKSWAGLAFADLQQVCKDPDQILAVKTLEMTPDKKWTDAEVMTGTTASLTASGGRVRYPARVKLTRNFIPRALARVCLPRSWALRL